MRLVFGQASAFVAASYMGLEDGEDDLAVSSPDGMAAPPRGDWHFYGTNAAHGGQARLHIFWAEPGGHVSQGLGLTWRDRFMLRDLYHAEYVVGRWKEPELVYRAESLGNYLVHQSEAVVDSIGNTHLVFVALASTRNALIHLWGDTGGWRAEPIPYGNAVVFEPGYPSIAIRPTGRLDLAFVAGIRGTPGGMQADQTTAILFQSSGDGGATWSAPIEVFALPSPASHVQLISKGEDTTYVFWLTPIARQQPLNSAIAYAVSEDAGKTWNSPKILPLPARVPGLSRFRAAMTPTGSVEVLMLTSLSSPKQSMWRGELQDGRLKRAQMVRHGAGRRPVNIALSVDSTGTRYIAWAHARQYDAADPPGFVDLSVSLVSMKPCAAKPAGASSARYPLHELPEATDTHIKPQ